MSCYMLPFPPVLVNAYRACTIPSLRPLPRKLVDSPYDLATLQHLDEMDVA